jgi:phosphoribosylformylglycinamidine synthase
MKFAVVVFPGSNSDHDAHYAVEHPLGEQARFVWHKDTSLATTDAVILPGGFAHGDYLRTGRHRALLADHGRRAALCRRRRRRCSASATASRCCSRRGLLPGAMLRNDSLHFRCEFVSVRVEHADTPFTAGLPARPGAADADRARRRQLLRGTRRCWRGSNETGRCSSATSMPPAR